MSQLQRLPRRNPLTSFALLLSRAFGNSLATNQPAAVLIGYRQDNRTSDFLWKHSNRPPRYRLLGIGWSLQLDTACKDYNARYADLEHSLHLV